MEAVKITDNLVMTKNILEGHDLSFSSLRKYVRKGWISGPVLRSFDGKSGGKSLFWKRSVLTQIALIKTLKDLKKTDNQISDILQEGR